MRRPSVCASNRPTLKSRGNFAGRRSKIVSRARGSLFVETKPAGLCKIMCNGRSARTSLPSTFTWSRSADRALKSVQRFPLMVTRPSAISSSQCRREPRPAAARKRFKRTDARENNGFSVRLDAEQFLNVRLGFRKANDFSAFLPLPTLLQQFHALEALQDVAPG